ncbi:four-carbon acid sugar kinase family protein [Nonomuraea sp. PA05]|uniref:four-carbon acid sugar kinase family protein n=1 Tax=Nonomuraea sp. PA05 TaxID=2604466 RepID=UPI0016520FD3|nr:four-carbon acid sugar kinase family protein [Nonomuraea sp. PA05]
MTLVAFVADDFTGATDALWQFRRLGLSGSLVTDVEHLHDRDDVIGLATTARASADPVASALPALRAVAALGPRVVQYKVCSTFDSSPSRGSIGAVIAALHGAGLARGAVPVLAAQPEFGRYTWFANHFVRAGDEVVRLDRHPPARDHPVTPATEADLRVRLAEQGAGPVGWLPAEAPAERYLAQRADAAVVADAMTDAHLVSLGRLLLGLAGGETLYCVGSGGLSYALATALTSNRHAPPEPGPASRHAPPEPGPASRHAPPEPGPASRHALPHAGAADRHPPPDGAPATGHSLPGAGAGAGAADRRSLLATAPTDRRSLLDTGSADRCPLPDAGPADRRPLDDAGAALGPAAPVLVVSGSRSPVTARQIDVAEAAGWAVLDASGGPDLIAHTEANLREGRHTIVQSTRGPAREGVGDLLGRVAAAAVRRGLVRRLVVAGGDTSGQVVTALGARALDVTATLAVGGPVCVLASDDPACDGLEVALKGGQVGGEDFFLRAAAGTRASS